MVVDNDKVALRDYLEARIDAVEKAAIARADAQDKAVTAALAAQQAAVQKTEVASEKRFECVAADTPILCADLIWRAARELQEGDELIAFDETSPDRRGRRFRRATVTDNSLAEDDLLIVNTSMGAVRCNARHPWLTRPQNEAVQWKWVETRNLMPRDAVHCPLDVWSVDESWDSGWLAGMYDGEGCLTLDKNKRSQLTMSQRESATSARIERVLKSRVDFVGVYRKEPGTPSTPRNTCPFFHFIISHMPDMLTILGSVRPPRLLAKATIAWMNKPIGGWHRSAIVDSVQNVGSGLISRLSTSTKTYIAAGFAMHNSVNEFRSSLNDQGRLMMPRTESEKMHEAALDRHNIAHAAVVSRLDHLAARVTAHDEQRAGKAVGWTSVVSVIALIASVIGVLAFLTR